MLALTEEQLEQQGVTKGARHKIALSILRLRERPTLLAQLEKVDIFFLLIYFTTLYFPFLEVCGINVLFFSPDRFVGSGRHGQFA